VTKNALPGREEGAVGKQGVWGTLRPGFDSGASLHRFTTVAEGRQQSGLVKSNDDILRIP
jgi:hypothetical protein